MREPVFADDARASAERESDVDPNGNDRARRLYQSLGYRETAVVMRKDLP